MTPPAPSSAPESSSGPLRPATRDDIPALARLWALAFPGERSAEDRAAALEDGGPWGGWENCWVAGPTERIDGGLRTLPLTVHLFGRPVPTLGVAAVAVAPHARRRGLGGAMCRAALRIGRARGDELAALHPFRADFYARLGFGLAGELHRYRLAPGALCVEGDASRVEHLADPFVVIPELHRVLVPGIHGGVSRSDRRWEALLGRRGQLAFGIRGDGGDWLGYLLGTVQKRGRGRGFEFHVAELAAGDAAARSAALAWLGEQRDAWASVVVDALPGERLHEALAHPSLPGTGKARELWFQSATILRGPMVRILHARALLARLGGDAGASVTLDDPEFPENRGRWVLDPEEGGARRDPSTPTPGVPLPVGVASTRLVEGQLPGFGGPREGFDPPPGREGFHLTDAF
jgi:predicted acetyltransferase